MEGQLAVAEAQMDDEHVVGGLALRIAPLQAVVAAEGLALAGLLVARVHFLVQERFE